MTVTPKLSIGKGTRILARKGSRGGARRPAGASRARVLADDLLDRLRRQAVERLHGELEVLRGPDDRRDDARLGDDAAHRADGAFAGSLGDFPDLELEPRSAGERVAALVHRSGAGVRGLAAERDLVTLDAERAEDDPERQ